MVLKHDILNLAALMVLCITGSQQEDILDQRGSQAEKLVELFHNVSPRTEGSENKMLIRT